MGPRVKYTGIIRDDAGNVYPSVIVFIYLSGTTTTATIYDAVDAVSPAGNITTNTSGQYTFYVDLFDYNYTQRFKIYMPASINTSQRTVTYDSAWSSDIVEGTYAISADKTISTHIRVPKGVTFAIATGKTLTFSSGFEAGRYQVFSGSGTVSFTGAVDEVYPEWWGAVVGSDSITALQSAIDTGLPVILSGTYFASDTLNFNNTKSQAILLGKNWKSESTSTGTGITFTDDSKPGIKIDFTSSGLPQAIIKDILLKGAAGSTDGHNGIYLPGGTGRSIAKLTIENVMLDDWGDDGMHLSGQTGPVRIKDCSIYDCNGWGIYIVDDSDTNRPSEMIIDGGVIQGTCLGGIGYDCSVETNGALKIIGIDIELDSNTKPLIYLKNLYGSTVLNPTLATSATSVTDDAVVVIDGKSNGIQLIGLYNSASGGINNVNFKSGANNSIIGGFYSNKSSGYPSGLGYFCKLTSNDFHQIIAPSLASTYDTGHNIVYDPAGSNSNAVVIISNCMGFTTQLAPSANIDVDTLGIAGAPLYLNKANGEKVVIGSGGLAITTTNVGNKTGDTPAYYFPIYDESGSLLGNVQIYTAA
jgi:hypothetical protein